MEDDPIDPVSFVRDVVSTALWHIRYHEERLSSAYRKLRFACEIIKRCDFDPDGERALHDDDDDEDEIFENAEQFALSIFDDCKDSAEFHEHELARAQTRLAMAKIMLERGNYTEIDIEQIIKADQEKRRHEEND